MHDGSAPLRSQKVALDARVGGAGNFGNAGDERARRPPYLRGSRAFPPRLRSIALPRARRGGGGAPRQRPPMRLLPVRGLPALREAIAAHHARLHGAAVKADNVVVGPGSKQLMYLVQLVLDVVTIVPTPAWVSYVPQARLARARASRGRRLAPGMPPRAGRAQPRRRRRGDRLQRDLQRRQHAGPARGAPSLPG